MNISQQAYTPHPPKHPQAAVGDGRRAVAKRLMASESSYHFITGVAMLHTATAISSTSARPISHTPANIRAVRNTAQLYSLRRVEDNADSDSHKKHTSPAPPPFKLPAKRRYHQKREDLDVSMNPYQGAVIRHIQRKNSRPMSFGPPAERPAVPVVNIGAYTPRSALRLRETGRPFECGRSQSARTEFSFPRQIGIYKDPAPAHRSLVRS